MAKENQAMDLVLEIVRGQQSVIEKLLVEVHGGERPGLRENVTELRGKMDAVETQLADLSTDKRDRKRTRSEWTREIITWAITIALAFTVGHIEGGSHP